MAFTVPSLLDVWTRARNAMRAYLPGTDAWIEPNNLSIWGRVLALALGSAYERLLHLYRQLFASSADGEHLEFRHAFEYGLTRKSPAPAEGLVTFTQSPGPFVTIPSGYQITRADGLVYRFVADAVPSPTGVCSVRVRCDTAGAQSNTLPRTPLAIASDEDYPNLPSEAAVDAQGLSGGADVESDDELRARVLLRKRLPPHGGARSDYQQWALEVPGVTRCFVSPFKVRDDLSATPLTVYPLFDDSRVNGVPTPDDLALVAAHIDALRPVTARVYHAAAQPVQIGVRIVALQPDTPAIRAAIEANLAAMFIERMPVATADNLFTLPVAWIDEAIARAEGYRRHRLVSPVDDVAFRPGSLPILGPIFYGL